LKELQNFLKFLKSFYHANFGKSNARPINTIMSKTKKEIKISVNETKFIKDCTPSFLIIQYKK
jgi:hypothetical protein